MQIKCEIEYTELENENGYLVEGVTATCQKCGAMTESFGTGEASVKRSLAIMPEECECEGDNFYVEAGEAE